MLARCSVWLNLAATLLARMVQNAAVVTLPKAKACQLKHLQLVSLQDTMALVVLVLGGASVRQQLLAFEQAITQAELAAIAGELSTAYSGLTAQQISAKGAALPAIEQQITNCLVEVMETEDAEEYEGQYFDGLHFMLNQPEFAQNQRLLALMELLEQRSLMRTIVPARLSASRVQVVIGKENKTKAIHDYSVVVSRYGLPKKAVGTIGVIGPTRMPYARTIATVDYISSVLSGLEGTLHGKSTPVELNQNCPN